MIGLERKVVLCTFEKNRAYKGGVVYATQCPVMQMHDVTLSSNSARVGVMYLVESSSLISGNTTIIKSIGSLFVYNSKVGIAGVTKLISPIARLRNSTIQVYRKEERSLLFKVK